MNLLDEINELLETNYLTLDDVPREALLRALAALLIADKINGGIRESGLDPA